MSDGYKLIAYIKEKILDEIETLEGGLADGKISSMEEYRHVAGQIAAYRNAITILRNAVKYYDSDESEEI